MNIILIGYRASGKTSVGRELAKILERPFFDSDRMVFAKTGRTIGEIVEAGGWQAFREVEKTVIGELANLDDAVIALGGGAVMDPDNVAMLAGRGSFVWLKADAPLLAMRMSGDQDSASQRPALTGTGAIAEVEEVLAARTPVYRDVAHVIVDTSGKEPARIAQEIADHLAAEKGRRKRRRVHAR